MSGVTSGNPDLTFFELYDQYYASVRRFILGIVKDEWAADDIIQDTFTRVRHRLETVKDPSKVSAWIHRIAYNLCQDHFRSLKRTPNNVCQIQEKTGAFDGREAHRALEQRQMGTCVQDQMDLLPDSLRPVLILHDVLDFKQKEIAEILEITVENVKVRLHRARKKFRSILEEKCSFERDERNVLVCEPRETSKASV